MAFTRQDIWDARIEQRGVGNAAAAALSGRVPILGESASHFLNKTGAILLSAIIHLLLLWLLANKLAGAPGPDEGPGVPGGSMTLIDLSGSSAPAARSPPATAPVPAPTQKTELDLTVPTELAPSEWTIAQIQILMNPTPERKSASGVTVPNQPSGAMAASSVTSGTATGAGGDASYDPYAGAAPQRRKQDGVMTSLAAIDNQLGVANQENSEVSELVLNRDALTDIARRVARSMPKRRGTAEFVVRVSPAGIILEATATGGSGPNEIRTALRHALLGKHLYSAHGNVGEAKMVRLPVIRL